MPRPTYILQQEDKSCFLVLAHTNRYGESALYPTTVLCGMFCRARTNPFCTFTFHIYVLCDTSSLFYSLCSIVLVSHRAWSSENRIALIVLVLKVRLKVVLLFSKISTTLLIRGVLNTDHARMSTRSVHFLGCSKSSIPKPLQSEHVRACSVLELWCSWA